ncbi:hypothetical protein TNCV_1977271 [Trichonephila clavipes]|nr:hypothetical protein TNCV_1977271 [Trichonephila clavipes]
MGSLVVRASDSRPEGLCLMPDATNPLRVHTEYVFVKLVGHRKTCGQSQQKSRGQGAGEYSPTLQFHA